MYVVPLLETLDGVTMYSPGTSAWNDCVPVRGALNPPGPVIEPCADAPGGSPETLTVRVPVVGAGGVGGVSPPQVQLASAISSHDRLRAAAYDGRLSRTAIAVETLGWGMFR
jgi:hypothetical protein